jgi:hypothetical protein
MKPRLFVLLAVVAGCVGAQAAPEAVIPIFPSKSVRTFDQDSGGVPGEPVPAGSFPVSVIKDSPDGQRYQVDLKGRSAWVPKSDVRPKENIDAKQMCSTVVASIQAGATRNANEACRSK